VLDQVIRFLEGPNAIKGHLMATNIVFDGCPGHNWAENAPVCPENQNLDRFFEGLNVQVLDYYFWPTVPRLLLKMFTLKVLKGSSERENG